MARIGRYRVGELRGGDSRRRLGAASPAFVAGPAYKQTAGLSGSAAARGDSLGFQILAIVSNGWCNSLANHGHQHAHTG